MSLVILGIAIFSAIAVLFSAGYYALDAIQWVRAWLYVRFFLRYEMPGCAVEAKVREGQG
jgi:hypothetical protein